MMVILLSLKYNVQSNAGFEANPHTMCITLKYELFQPSTLQYSSFRFHEIQAERHYRTALIAVHR